MMKKPITHSKNYLKYVLVDIKFEYDNDAPDWNLLFSWHSMTAPSQ